MKKVFKFNLWAAIAAAILLLGAGLLIGWVINGNLRANTYPIREANKDKYKFINPLLAYDTDEPKQSELSPLRNKLQAFIQDEISLGLANQISVYFREPLTGNWAGINEDIKYNPASLLKVPTMIAFFKLAESHPEILSKEVQYDGTFDDNKYEYFKPQQAIQPGQFYTIKKLIEAMIAYSDNNATRLLHENIDPDLLKEVYTDLGLSIPNSSAYAVDFMSAKAYSLFFRVLYNATYLNREFSEEALALLLKPDFPKGIEAGIPKNINVAQKFGERNILASDNPEKELHDCGIIYYPAHPYLLCVMTKGNDFEKLSLIIQEISRRVYNWTTERYH